MLLWLLWSWSSFRWPQVRPIVSSWWKSWRWWKNWKASHLISSSGRSGIEKGGLTSWRAEFMMIPSRKIMLSAKWGTEVSTHLTQSTSSTILRNFSTISRSNCCKQTIWSMFYFPDYQPSPDCQQSTSNLRTFRSELHEILAFILILYDFSYQFELFWIKKWLIITIKPFLGSQGQPHLVRAPSSRNQKTS